MLNDIDYKKNILIKQNYKFSKRNELCLREISQCFSFAGNIILEE